MFSHLIRLYINTGTHPTLGITYLKIEFVNLNEDPGLDPEVKETPLSKDSKHKPPSYCLPWVEATRYSIQIKSNEENFIRQG